MTYTLHNDGAPRRAHTYPVPMARVLDDSERNQLDDLRHEACQDHCTECGCCDWRPTGPMSDEPVPIVNGLCPDCTPRPSRRPFIADPDEMGSDPDWGTYS